MKRGSLAILALFAALLLTTMPVPAADTQVKQADQTADPDKSEAATTDIESPPGDINCNLVRMEVADLIMYSNYFHFGLSAFEDHTLCSIAESDINGDGLALTVADLVLMYRVIIGDTTLSQPPPAPETAEPQTDR